MKVVYTERALQDINDIYLTIAANSPTAAQRVEDFIRATCDGFADFPLAAPATDVPNVRRAPLVRYPYTVFYYVDAARDLVEIARVLHSARVTNLRQMPDDNGN